MVPTLWRELMARARRWAAVGQSVEIGPCPQQPVRFRGRPPVQSSVEDLFLRFRRGETRALAAVFDRTAGELWRVARCLSKDRGAADDLVQATYLSAMQSAARWRAEQPLMPWLLGILANHVRRAARRERREVPAAALVERAAEDPVVAAERQELREVLRARVEELPETYRAVLVLQLEHGMTAAEVAHALGRPRATVRSQLHRGLEMLRRTLPAALAVYAGHAESVPDLGRVRGALMAAAGVSTAVVGTAVGVGVMAMKKLMAVVVVVLVAGVYWAWPGGAAVPPATAVAVAPLPIAAAASNEAKPDVDAPSVKRVEVKAPVVASGSTRLVVRAHWSDGTPSTAMAITVQSLPDDDWFAQRIADTDARGVVEFADLAAGKVRVRARHGGVAEAEVAAGATTEVELAIPAGIDARGTVVDPDGNPVAGASIVVGEESDAMLQATRSDGNGAFLLRSLAKDTLVAAFADCHFASQVVRAEEFEAGPQQLQLRGVAGTIRGRVFDADGQPLAGAWVAHGHAAPAVVGRTWAISVVLTDRNGDFELHGVPVFGASPLHVGAAGHASFLGSVRAGPAEPPVEVHLQRAAQLRGTARDQAGAPIHCFVTVRDNHAAAKGAADQRPSWCQAQQSTRADGCFAFGNLPAGGLVVAARTNDSRVAGATFEARPGDVLRWDPVLSSDLAIRGAVVDARGQPMVGWRISAEGPDGMPGPQPQTTGQDGAFALVGCVDADYTVAVMAGRTEWYLPIVQQRGVKPGGEPLRLVIGRDAMPSCRVFGRLAADQPGGELGLALVGSRGGSMSTGSLEPGREFELGPMPPGRYSLQTQGKMSLESRGGPPWVQAFGSFELQPDERRDLGELRLPQFGDLAAELRDAAGQPVAKATVTLALVGAPMGGLRLQFAAGRAQARLAPGSYLPSVTSASGPFHVEHAPIVVEAGQTTTVQLQLATGVVRELCYDLSRVGLPMRAFATFHKGGAPLQRVWFDFRLDESTASSHHFTPGSWELELELGDGRVQKFPFVVTADAEAPPIDIRVLP